MLIWYTLSALAVLTRCMSTESVKMRVFYAAIAVVFVIGGIALCINILRPEKDIALTFDDGPYGTSTEEVLAILNREHIHATFFLIGKNVLEFPAEARDELADGDIIGNHSYDHSEYLAQMAPAEFADNLTEAETAIASTTGVFPRFFRAPYGNTSPALLRELSDKGYVFVSWNSDPRDWDYANSPSDQILKTVLASATPNGIILLHDGRDVLKNYPRDNMIAALPQIIASLKSEGYTFVTLEALLHQTPYFKELR